MAQDTLASLRTIEPTVLRAVIRQDQCSPAFELIDWTVAPLSHHKIIATTISKELGDFALTVKTTEKAEKEK